MSNSTDYSSTINEVFASQAWDTPPRFEKGSLKASATTIDEPAKVREIIKQFDARAGWIQSASSVVLFDALEEAVGHIIAAELANEDRSLHIRQSPKGGWTATYYEYVDNGSGLISTRKFLARGGPKAFYYQVAWRLEPTEDGLEEYRPYAARLIEYT